MLTTWYRSLTILTHPRAIIVLLLNIASALPTALIGSTLIAWFKNEGINIETIGLLGLVGQPYVFKVLWAPLIDRFQLPWLTRKRDWMLLTQIILAILIFLLGQLQPQKTPWVMAILAFSIAFCSATQDIAINGYQTELLQKDELGIGSTYTTLGYRIGTIISGAMALILSDEIGWKHTYQVMAGCMLGGVIVTLISPKLKIPMQTHYLNLGQTIIQPFHEFFSRFQIRLSLLILLMMITYKLSDAFALSLNTAFLVGPMHFSNTEVGIYSKSFGLFAAIAGGLVGGVLMSRLKLATALWYFGWLQIFSNLGFVIMTFVGHNLPLMAIAMMIESFCSGLGTAAFLAFTMALCAKSFSGTQFALFSAISAIGRVYSMPLAGIIVAHFGWTWLYLFSILFGLPCMILVWWLCRHPCLAAYL